MKMEEEPSQWRLIFQDGVVQQIQIDFRLVLLLSDKLHKATLVIETPFRLQGVNIDVVIIPEKSPSL